VLVDVAGGGVVDSTGAIEVGGADVEVIVAGGRVLTDCSTSTIVGGTFVVDEQAVTRKTSVKHILQIQVLAFIIASPLVNKWRCQI